MATIMCLPDEMIAIILGYSDITIEDINNFRCVCKRFRYAAKYDTFLEKKMSQRWPVAKKMYDKLFKNNEQEESEEYEPKRKKLEKNSNFMEIGTKLSRQFRNYVSQINYKYHHGNESINNFTKFECIFYLNDFLRNFFDQACKYGNLENYFIRYIFFDEIKHSLTQSPRRTDCDLTERYCIEKIYHYMKRYLMKKKYDEFKEVPSRMQLFEWTAYIAAQSIHLEKNIIQSCIIASLDSIALGVQNYLREKHPHHSIFSRSAESLSYCRNNNIDDNYWNEVEGTQIIDTLDEYIFGKLNFRPCDSEDTNLEYMCIDNVLKTRYGQEIILIIIYHAVARRLGLRCDIMVCPLNIATLPIYCIYWKSNYGMDNSANERCFNIISKKFPDCLVDKLCMLKSFPPSEYPKYKNFNIISPTMMREKIIEGTTDLIYNFNNISQINRRKSKRFCKHQLKLCVKKTAQFITRSEDIKFAVGMIVTHRDMCKNNCTGVIIGWDRHIDRHVKITNHCIWPDEYTEIDFLPLNHCRNNCYKFRKQQTNYIILTDNNKICYVEEDSITLTTPKWIDNSETGRYFCKFEKTHYVPNKMLASFYPQDAAITAKQQYQVPI